jgi:hypothetical protein
LFLKAQNTLTQKTLSQKVVNYILKSFIDIFPRNGFTSCARFPTCSPPCSSWAGSSSEQVYQPVAGTHSTRPIFPESGTFRNPATATVSLPTDRRRIADPVSCMIRPKQRILYPLSLIWCQCFQTSFIRH